MVSPDYIRLHGPFEGGLEGIQRDMDKGMEGYEIGVVIAPIVQACSPAYNAYRWVKWLFD